jgi:putative FmdB family regulatory protein
MALYEYICPLCRAVTTVTHSISATHESKCANCKVDLIKKFSAPSVSFKGNGWGHQA